MDYSMVMELSNYARIFKALSSEQRLRIFMLIYKNCCAPADTKLGSEFNFMNDPCCTNEKGGLERAFTKVCDCMDLSRSTVSHHFKELQSAGLITCEREGQNYRCTVNENVVKEIKDFLK